MNPRKLANRQASRYNKQLITLLLIPSWASGIISSAIALGATTVLLFQGRYQGSELQQQYLNWRTATDSNSVGSAASTLQQSTANIVATAEVFILWCAVGTIIYLVGAAIYHTIRSAHETRQHLYYVNSSRKEFLRGLYAILTLRIIILITWVGYSLLTLKVIIPYLLGAIHISDEHLPAIGAIGLLATSLLGILCTFHIHVIMLRLLLARPRAFHGEEYIEAMSTGH
jgi:hypothetical protein